MDDTRLQQIEAAFDDARTLIADLEDDDAPQAWRQGLGVMRSYANAAIDAKHRFIDPHLGRSQA